ncbi:hypothetical protein [Desulfonema magnum]|uniref:Uncharacterized protein n=1 Tax=Desulfonema magnum TaxID=45655 RepID=A0A975BUE7_9BACT|nr:hypothetical protein [Desulfonema magnum]QTA91924.1 Uncharacterized protein dnm_079970 [Desulfonema magnum]
MFKFLLSSLRKQESTALGTPHLPKIDSCFRRNDKLFVRIGSKKFDHRVKIKCGKKHYEIFEQVEYKQITKLRELADVQKIGSK